MHSTRSSAPAVAPGGPPAVSSPPHALSAEEVVSILGTDARAGLSSAAARGLLARHGPNTLAQAPAEPWWRRLARQFADLLIWILIAAALISGALGEWIDAAAIMAIVILNGVLGFIQEGRAEQALASLRKLSSPTARVVRDGRPQNMPAADLVPGDRIDLEAGDRVPADARLIASAGLHAEEAARIFQVNASPTAGTWVLIVGTALIPVTFIEVAKLVTAGRAAPRTAQTTQR